MESFAKFCALASIGGSNGAGPKENSGCVDRTEINVFVFGAEAAFLGNISGPEEEKWKRRQRLGSVEKGGQFRGPRGSGAHFGSSGPGNAFAATSTSSSSPPVPSQEQNQLTKKESFFEVNFFTDFLNPAVLYLFSIFNPKYFLD